jgi:hypothetical protein
MKRDLIRLLAGILAITGLFSCATPPHGTSIDGIPAAPVQSGASSNTNGYRAGEQAINRNSIDSMLNNPERRPGLATGWGNEKVSTLTGQAFTRASSKPAGTDAIYYNNKQGIEAMSRNLERVEGMQTAAGNLVEWGVKGHGGFLQTYKEGYGYGRRLVAGEADSNYKIVIRNRSKSTLEIVASVDGLDVFDGKPASFSKHGYLVNPGATLEIDGFRTSYNSVAAFKFSGVANSYANLRHGDTRNVGVIGIAVFTQKGINPWTWMPDEINRRTQAQPFAQAP